MSTIKTRAERRQTRVGHHKRCVVRGSGESVGHIAAEALNIWELRELAERRLPKLFFEFVDRGTEDEVGLRNNRSALERIKLKPRVLRNVENRVLAVEVLGQRQKLPIVVSPTGIAGLLWHNGEIALAKAAHEAGIPFTLATTSVTAMEEVAECAGGNLWYQLYMWPDQAMSYSLIDRARAAGFQALVVTVDTVVAPNREYNVRNGYSTSFHFRSRNVLDVLRHPRWLFATLGKYFLAGGMPRFENYPPALRHRITGRGFDQRSLMSQSVTWEDIKSIRKRWPNALVLKGILHPDDAKLAADSGADAIVVSNHGARNLDGSVAPIDMLEQIADAVAARITVLVDSGFRRGSDVVKALALGAKAVLVGRGPLYGVAAGGQEGAARALQIYKDEIDRTLAYLGCATTQKLSKDYLFLQDRFASPQ